MEQKTYITVAICTYNRERYLPQLFKSIEQQTIDASLIEVILVDNNSPGNTKDLGELFAQNNPKLQYRYFLETNQGLSYARNRCIKEAKGEIIVFLDDDAVSTPNYLELVAQKFKADDQLQALGGKIHLHFETDVPDWENPYLNSLLGYYDKGNQEFIYDGKKNNYPRGSNMAFRSFIFEEIGNFNVKLGRVGSNLMAGEEKDIFNRIFEKKKYKVVYFPDLLIIHSVPKERTGKDFIQRQAHLNGISEKIRSKNEGIASYLKRILLECIKWGASFYLWIIYAIKGQKAKGDMIIYFRYWVTKGLLLGK